MYGPYLNIELVLGVNMSLDASTYDKNQQRLCKELRGKASNLSFPGLGPASSDLSG